jgi:TRAP transporter 4TM/12TM fusion protein
MDKKDVPSVRATFWRGAHYLLPIILLVHLLIVERMTTGTSVFWATLMLMAIIMVQEFLRHKSLQGLYNGMAMVIEGLISGARNMISVAIAVAAAGIIVGAVASTGLSNALSGVVETLAGGNIYLLLGLIAVLALVLGLGLPTTANYLVVASLMAPVIVEVGAASGLELPLIAVHLFVFYFGLMADVTPPVGLAAYAAAGISKADPIKTGVQAFFYSIRTAILPFIFIFNLNLLMIGIESWAHAALVIFVSTLALMCFVSLTQRWMFTKLGWGEMGALALVMVALFRPAFFMDFVSPRWQNMTAEHFHKAGFIPHLRLGVLREGEYGQKRRLLAFHIDEQKKPTRERPGEMWTVLGIKGQYLPDNQGILTVGKVSFMGLADKADIKPDDKITFIERRNPAPLAKELIFIPALLLLALIGFTNRTRARRFHQDAD